MKTNEINEEIRKYVFPQSKQLLKFKKNDLKNE